MRARVRVCTEGFGVLAAGSASAAALAATAVAVPAVQIGRGLANTPAAIGSLYEGYEWVTARATSRRPLISHTQLKVFLRRWDAEQREWVPPVARIKLQSLVGPRRAFLT